MTIRSTAGQSCTDDPLVRNTRAIEPFARVFCCDFCEFYLSVGFGASFDEENDEILTSGTGWRVIDE